MSRFGPASRPAPLASPLSEEALSAALGRWTCALTQSALLRSSSRFAAIVVGLLVMMWPILTKVQYEKLPQIFSTKKMWFQIAISLVLNWIVGPFVSVFALPPPPNNNNTFARGR